jgi:hypothetical protein
MMTILKGIFSKLHKTINWYEVTRTVEDLTQNDDIQNGKNHLT